jgi:hypothetical protein
MMKFAGRRRPPVAKLAGLLIIVLLLVWLDAAAQAQPAAPPTDYQRFLPILARPPAAGSLPAPIPVSDTPPIDFAAIRATLQAQGLDLAFNKIGFHTGMGGNTTGLSQFMVELDAAGVPFFLKSADNAAPIYEAQQLMQASGVPHTLVFRRTGLSYDQPDYSLTPQQAAANHWQHHMAAWPPELDPSLVWIETVNEVDKNRADWLGQFALATAALAQRDGFRWAAFGFSSGEPEPEHWAVPSMRQFLALAAQNPTWLAVALHEYSFDDTNIAHAYPYLVGRFQALFQVCDQYNLGRPTILITEWGWHAETLPEPDLALDHIAWANWLYAAYPQVKGAAIWYLGGGFGGIADLAQQLIAPLNQYAQSHYFIYTPGRGTIDPAIFVPPPPAPLRPVMDEPGR